MALGVVGEAGVAVGLVGLAVRALQVGRATVVAVRVDAELVLTGMRAQRRICEDSSVLYLVFIQKFSFTNFL